MKLETQLIEVWFGSLCVLYQEVASKLEIKAMPTFLLMREGAQVDKLVGANPDEIRKRTEAFIRSSRSHKMTWICEYANYIFSESLQFWIHFDVFFLMLLTLGGNVLDSFQCCKLVKEWCIFFLMLWTLGGNVLDSFQCCKLVKEWCIFSFNVIDSWGKCCLGSWLKTEMNSEKLPTYNLLSCCCLYLMDIYVCLF